MRSIATTDVEEAFFRAGDELSETGIEADDEHDHDAWRAPRSRFRLPLPRFGELLRRLQTLVARPASVVEPVARQPSQAIAR
jgi:hypothetical protein